MDYVLKLLEKERTLLQGEFIKLRHLIETKSGFMIDEAHHLNEYSWKIDNIDKEIADIRKLKNLK